MKKEPSPLTQPCKTCRHFIKGWCNSLNADVLHWWTGCIRHKQKESLK